MEDYTIPLGEAVTLTTQWRTNNPNKVRAFNIPKAEIEELFEDSNAVSMRAYLGENSSGDMKLMLVGVDASGKDILDKVYDHCTPCPNACDATSVLNIGS